MHVNDITYHVSEIFRSIQGEGNYAGVNSMFIRFQLCNLTCNWCDSKFTWYEKSGSFSTYSVEALQKIIVETEPFHIIFTGGEPTMYRLDSIAIANKKFHVETNGMVIPTSNVDLVLKDGSKITRGAMDKRVLDEFNWVVSPKLSNSYQELDEIKIKFWNENTQCIFKFIVRSTIDLDEVEELVSKLNILQRRVYIALEGYTLQSQLQPGLVDEIVNRGYNFSPRLHTILWGSMRKK